ncbi:unnamed protein product, partial [Rotaria sp. Silwood1]
KIDVCNYRPVIVEIGNNKVSMRTIRWL